MSKKVLTIGSTMHDIFIEYAQNTQETPCIEKDNNTYMCLQEGKKVEIQKLTYRLGGGAANSATSFALLGFNTYIASKTGTDRERDFTVSTLATSNVDTSFLKMSKNEPTGTALIIPCPSGNNAILVHRGANLTLNESDLPLKQLGNFDIVHITSLSGTTSQLLPIITQEAKKHGIFVSTNPGSSQLTLNVQTLKDSLKNIDVLICNQFEAQLLLKHFDPSASFDEKIYLEKIIQQGPKFAAVTCGKNGVYATDGNTLLFQESIQTKITSTVGAGDAFSSTFVAYLANNHPLKQALYAGVAQSAGVLQKIGATEGLLDKESLTNR